MALHVRCPSTVMVLMIHPVLHINHRNHHSACTPIDCSCLICSGIAVNDEVVAMDDFIDVGNILGKIWVSLCQDGEIKKNQITCKI